VADFVLRGSPGSSPVLVSLLYPPGLSPNGVALGGARSKRLRRRHHRGCPGRGTGAAAAPQTFKEGASTLRNAQNRIHISCSAAAGVVRGWG